MKQKYNCGIPVVTHACSGKKALPFGGSEQEMALICLSLLPSILLPPAPSHQGRGGMKTNIF